MIVGQGNILDVFLNFAAMMAVMEIDDLVGVFFVKFLSSQSKTLQKKVSLRHSANVNFIICAYGLALCITAYHL